MEREFSTYSAGLDYVKQTWLDKYKDRLVWDSIMHFGNVNEMGSECTFKIEEGVGFFFEMLWTKIYDLLELQHTNIKASFLKSLVGMENDFEDAIFKDLMEFISSGVMSMIL